jgi:hypothetical protein
MTKKLTSIQTLIQDMETLKKTKLYQGSFKAIDDCIALANFHSSGERLDLIEGHVQGQVSGCGQGFEDEAIDYFNQTYK